jgi:hypothetical protein
MGLKTPARKAGLQMGDIEFHRPLVITGLAKQPGMIMLANWIASAMLNGSTNF